MPLHMIVWGDHWKNTVHELSGISLDRISIFGQIRTDIVEKLAKNKDGTPTLYMPLSL